MFICCAFFGDGGGVWTWRLCLLLSSDFSSQSFPWVYVPFQIVEFLVVFFIVFFSLFCHGKWPQKIHEDKSTTQTKHWWNSRGIFGKGVDRDQKFPNAVVLNAVRRRRAQRQVHKRAPKGARFEATTSGNSQLPSNPVAKAPLPPSRNLIGFGDL